MLKRANSLLLVSIVSLGFIILGAQPAMARPYAGPQPKMGVGISLHHHVPASGQSLLLSYRQGEYGLIGFGWVGEAGYRFGEGAGVFSVGAELWFTVVGLRLDAVLESEFDTNKHAAGIAYRASFGIGPWGYINLGGQTLFGRGTEFISGIGFTYLWDAEEKKDDARSP